MFQQVSTVDEQEDKQTNQKILTERTLQEMDYGLPIS